ncbi:MAG: hypothetical protein NT142_10645, partial [Planctomycetota bacterium]|nr:hypothetical protein [Planctomycetota bacterium]
RCVGRTNEAEAHCASIAGYNCTLLTLQEQRPLITHMGEEVLPEQGPTIILFVDGFAIGIDVPWPDRFGAPLAD